MKKISRSEYETLKLLNRYDNNEKTLHVTKETYEKILNNEWFGIRTYSFSKQGTLIKFNGEIVAMIKKIVHYEKSYDELDMFPFIYSNVTNYEIAGAEYGSNYMQYFKVEQILTFKEPRELDLTKLENKE